MENTVLQRITSIVEYLGVSDRKFTQMINIPYTTYNTMIKRDASPSISVIENILNSFEEINPEWLVTGRGEMIRDIDNIELVKCENGQPFYDIDFVGGFDIMCNDQTVQPAYYINYKPFSGKEGVMWVNLTGRSMEPQLSHGDVIAIKEANLPLDYLPKGEVYAIVTDEFRTVKILAKSEKENHVKLIPANKGEEFSPIEIPTSIIRKVFYVLGSIKNL